MTETTETDSVSDDDVTAAGPAEGGADTGAGSSSGTVAGVGIAGALLAAAGWLGWRRRIGT
ncbi:MAG: LPXTG cell wall anchor domain-containing protein [Tetrasphaera sp.]|nr:LPXTG cell wall anchor domain-containing protein [Tetrasphaera sp.]